MLIEDLDLDALPLNNVEPGNYDMVVKRITHKRIIALRLGPGANHNLPGSGPVVEDVAVFVEMQILHARPWEGELSDVTPPGTAVLWHIDQNDGPMPVV